jgi:hypothetical protein
MALKAIGIVISLESKLLIVGDSVMGCFVQAPGDGDAFPDAVFYFGPYSSPGVREQPGRQIR